MDPARHDTTAHPARPGGHASTALAHGHRAALPRQPARSSTRNASRASSRKASATNDR